jgi:hypothetical protein
LILKAAQGPEVINWHAQSELTVLLTAEVMDGLPDFINMPQYLMDKLRQHDLEFLLATVLKSIKPTFSGSLDHRLN